MTRTEQINLLTSSLYNELKSRGVAKSELSEAVIKAVEFVKAKTTEALLNGEKVDLFGLCSMNIKQVSPRQYRNIVTGKAAESPAKKKVSIKPRKTLSQAVNNR